MNVLLRSIAAMVVVLISCNSSRAGFVTFANSGFEFSNGLAPTPTTPLFLGDDDQNAGDLTAWGVSNSATPALEWVHASGLAFEGNRFLSLRQEGYTPIVFQTIDSLDIGEEYTFSFAYGNAVNSVSGLKVWINGDTPTFFSNSGGTFSSVNWQIHSVTFLATSSSAIISFQATSASNEPYSVLLDGVVPEASSLILWGTGLALGSVLMEARRRRMSIA